MKKCPYCGKEISDTVEKCEDCSIVLDKKAKEKWYLKTSTLIISLLCVGPFALPLVWVNRRFSNTKKVVITVIVIVLTIYLTVVVADSLKRILDYYRQINQMGY